MPQLAGGAKREQGEGGTAVVISKIFLTFVDIAYPNCYDYSNPIK